MSGENAGPRGSRGRLATIVGGLAAAVVIVLALIGQFAPSTESNRANGAPATTHTQAQTPAPAQAPPQTQAQNRTPPAESGNPAGGEAAPGEPVADYPGGTIDVADLPPTAHETLALIDQGGPFPYRQDGSTFGNREGLLPDEAHGFYREYTVDRPGSPDRGPWRIVTGGDGPSVYYWTEDHYDSFRRIER